MSDEVSCRLLDFPGRRTDRRPRAGRPLLVDTDDAASAVYVAAADFLLSLITIADLQLVTSSQLRPASLAIVIGSNNIIMLFKEPEP
jgi:hypothetical protein